MSLLRSKQQPDVNTSRPDTQNSIQSSNSSLFNELMDVSRMKDDLKGEVTSIFDEDRGENVCVENAANDQDLVHASFSPIKGGGSGITKIQLDSTLSLDFLKDIPEEWLSLTVLQISAGLESGELKEWTSSQFTSSSKLTPCVVNYQDFSPDSKLAYHRTKSIEELLETEENYISSLKMLSDTYLESLILKGNDGIPLRLVYGYTKTLITNHQDFLSELKTLYYSPYNPFSAYSSGSIDSCNFNTEMVSCHSPIMAALIARVVGSKAVSLFIYQEFSSLYDLVLKLINAKESDPEFGSTLTRGYQLFLEASQSSNNHMDLSFSSLIQKPISRLAKYKLILDNLLKLTPISEDPFCHVLIEKSLRTLDDKLKQVNRYGMAEKSKANLIFQNLTFSPKTLKFPVEYLGLPILCGSLHCVWIERNRQIHSQDLAAFLFKTHLILAYVLKNNKFEVKFLIPLSVCKIEEAGDTMGGMFTNYENSFKILFEYNYSIFELLCLQYDDHEKSVWKEKLDILTNVVNGPYAFDYSSSKSKEENGTSWSFILPSYLLPIDIKLDMIKSSRVRKEKSNNFSLCYFHDVMIIQVQLNKIRDETQTVRTLTDDGGDRAIVLLFEIDRIRLGYLLEDFWSGELISTATQLRREKSSVDLKLLGSRRHQSNSFRTLGSRSINRSRSLISYSDSAGDETLSRATSIRPSIFRRTSIVFGSAIKSIMNSDH